MHFDTCLHQVLVNLENIFIRFVKSGLVYAFVVVLGILLMKISCMGVNICLSSANADF